MLGKYTADITGDNVLMVLQAGKTYYISDVVLFMGTEYPAQYKFFVDPEKYPEGFKVTGVRHAQIDSGTVLTNKVYYPRVILGDKDVYKRQPSYNANNYDDGICDWVVYILSLIHI